MPSDWFVEVFDDRDKWTRVCQVSSKDIALLYVQQWEDEERLRQECKPTVEKSFYRMVEYVRVEAAELASKGRP